MANVGLDHVKTVRAKGRDYLYFDTGERKNGKPVYVRLPDPSDIAFGTRYATLKANRTKRDNREKLATVDSLCRAYMLSAKFRNRRPNTQATYLYYIENMLRRLRDPKRGSWPVIQIERAHVRALLTPLGPGAQKMQLAVFRNVLVFGRKEDLIPETFEPDKGIEIDHDSIPHEPWPETLVETALADVTVRLPVGLLYFTGQRIERVCTMKWTDIEDGVVHIPPHKKQGDLYVPIHHQLSEILATVPKSLTTIICNPDGSPLSTAALRSRLQKWAAGKGQKVNPHGLRKNAVDALLEAGCSGAQVSAITGQSMQMIEHYARGRNNRKLGRSAVSLWERNTT